jgi:hypothetical protein
MNIVNRLLVEVFITTFGIMSTNITHLKIDQLISWWENLLNSEQVFRSKKSTKENIWLEVRGNDMWLERIT